MSNTDATAAGPLGPVQAKLAVLQAAKGLVDADLLEELARGILEAALTECDAQRVEAMQEPMLERPANQITVAEYLRKRGMTEAEVAKYARGFGQTAAAIHRKRYGGRNPYRTNHTAGGNVYGYDPDDGVLDDAFRVLTKRRAA